MNKNQLSEITSGINTFALELYRNIKESGMNVFFSPFSIHACMAMAYIGARERTATEIQHVFKITRTPQQFALMYKAFQDSLNQAGKEKGLELAVANSLWLQRGLNLLTNYLTTIETNFGKQLFEVDFSAGATKAQVNNWVSEQTKGKIPTIVDNIPPSTIMAIINAIYFKGNWLIPFDKDITEDLPFTLETGEKILVPTMAVQNTYRYLEGTNYQCLELMYENERFSMVILLPKEPNGLADLEGTLSIETLNQILKNASLQNLLVYIPKFSFMSTYNLNEPLKAMGLHDAFSDEAADFSGMTGAKTFCIELIIHKTFLDVNEEGTEAAAATAILTRMKAMPPPPPPIFRADHPFLFFVLDKQNDCILFMGSVSTPSL